MKIFLRNSEKLLSDKIESLPFKDHRLRCLHFSCSKLSEYNHDEVSKQLTNEMTSYPSQMYLMHDGDIFIITKGLLLRQFEQICEHMKPIMFCEDQDHTPEEIFHYYDLFKQYDLVCDLVNEKKDLYLKKPKPEPKISTCSEKQKAEEENEKKLTQDLYKNLIQTLQKRRNSRDNIEVLVIDDDDFSRKLIASSIEQNYTTETAADGFSGINTHIMKAPDITFLDIDLPDINGQIVLEKILKIDPHAFIVMLSGHKDQQNVVQAIQNGAKGFIGKPFKKEKLFKYLRARERDKENALCNVAPS